MDGSGGNAWLPPEGMHAAASLFSLIAESELKCNDFRTVATALHFFVSWYYLYFLIYLRAATLLI